MKLWKMLFRVLIGCGCVILIGTAGSCDLGNISLTQTVAQIVLAFALLGVGALGARMIYVKEKRQAIYRSHRRLAYATFLEDSVRRGA